MFVLAVLKDTICIKPHEFDKDPGETIERRLNDRLANKVVPELGLCICFYDLLEVGAASIIPGDGNAHTTIKFRFIIFRPFRDEVIEAKVVGSSREGLTLSVLFFEDIFIPADKLPDPHVFEEAEQVWHWQYEQEDGEPPAKLYLDPGKLVRFKVTEVILRDVKPDKDETKEKEKSMEVIGTMNETGLGCVAWWTQGEEEIAEEEEEAMDEE